MTRSIFSFLLLVLQTIAVPSAWAQAHDEWSFLLSKYVEEGEDGINRVDYAAFKRNDHDRLELNQYIQKLIESDVYTNGSKDEKFVAWVNLYNALTVNIVVENYPVKSIRDIGGNFVFKGPWKKKLVEIDGKKLSLDDIEHRILRKKWDEPRVHYAVNCASIGCPNLQPKAWEVETLESDLKKAAIEFITHPRGVEVLPDGRLRISKIYRWFKKDFGGSQVGVVMHLMKNAPADLASNLTAETMIKSYRYDWSLNDIGSKK